MNAPEHTPAVEPHITWRDIYRAVHESEERIVQTIRDAVAPIRSDVDDHENRLRRLEAEGSSEAKEAMRVALAVGVKLDALTAKHTLDATDLERRFIAIEGQRKGMLDTLSAGQKTVLLIVAVLGGLLTLSHLLEPLFQ